MASMAFSQKESFIFFEGTDRVKTKDRELCGFPLFLSEVFPAEIIEAHLSFQQELLCFLLPTSADQKV
jgi:hypothetical protein